MCLCRLVLTLSHEGGRSVLVPVRVTVRHWLVQDFQLVAAKGEKRSEMCFEGKVLPPLLPSQPL